MIFFDCSFDFNFHAVGVFSDILFLKMNIKMNFRIITKNHEVDPKIEFQSRKDGQVPSDNTGVEIDLRSQAHYKSPNNRWNWSILFWENHHIFLILTEMTMKFPKKPTIKMMPNKIGTIIDSFPATDESSVGSSQDMLISISCFTKWHNNSLKNRIIFYRY